jgi:hypothetical protein
MVRVYKTKWLGRFTRREVGAAWLAANAQQIARAIKENALQEVADDEEDAKP